MPQKRRRFPAEKKALSYSKDRRNSYGENDKAARKAIPRNKAKGHRSHRRRAAADLSRYEILDEDIAALTENALITDLDRFSRWSKCPDQSLRDHIDEQDRRREYRGGRKLWVKTRSTEARERGDTGFMWSWGGSDVASFFKKY
ncbi:MAG: hypothetical protein AAF250_10220 [Pseudomonadota bacterium]